MYNAFWLTFVYFGSKWTYGAAAQVHNHFAFKLIVCIVNLQTRTCVMQTHFQLVQWTRADGHGLIALLIPLNTSRLADSPDY